MEGLRGTRGSRGGGAEENGRAEGSGMRLRDGWRDVGRVCAEPRLGGSRVDRGVLAVLGMVPNAARAGRCDR